MKVLLAIAGLPHSRPTVDFARLIARATQAEVRLLNVIENESARPEAQATLAEAAKLLGDGAIEPLVRLGSATRQILAESREGGYDLLMIGAREEPSLTELILGSVARRVVAEAPCSVLVVKGERDAVKKLLICTGGKRFADATVEQGIHLATATEAQATLLYVTMAPATMYTGLDEVDQHLDELLRTNTPEARHLRRAAEAMQAAGVEGDLKLRHGAVVDEILREASRGAYDLIVVGARRRRGRLENYLWGDVTGQLLDRSTLPVLVARPAGL